jgi:hypothetical protein
MENNKGAERKYLAREWELRGVMRCSCGSTMGTHTTQPHGGRVYHYYKCKRRSQLGRTGSCAQKSLRVTEVEPEVWRFVSGLLRDPEKIRAGMEKLIDEEQAIGRGDPERESKAWAEKLEECGRLRKAYQQQQAAGLMSLEELGGMLKELEETRKLAETELRNVAARRNRVEELEQDRDDLLGYLTRLVPEGLKELSGEERNRVYRMLRLEVRPCPEGYEVQGVFSTSELLRCRHPAPVVLGDLRRERYATPFEVVDCLFEAALRLEGQDRSALRLRALGLAAVEADRHPVGVNLGPRPVSFDEREAQRVLVKGKRPLYILHRHPYVRHALDHFFPFAELTVSSVHTNLEGARKTSKGNNRISGTW